jgi:hypothetical protein
VVHRRNRKRLFLSNRSYAGYPPHPFDDHVIVNCADYRLHAVHDTIDACAPGRYSRRDGIESVLFIDQYHHMFRHIRILAVCGSGIIRLPAFNATDAE